MAFERERVGVVYVQRRLGGKIHLLRQEVATPHPLNSTRLKGSPICGMKYPLDGWEVWATRPPEEDVCQRCSQGHKLGWGPDE